MIQADRRAFAKALELAGAAVTRHRYAIPVLQTLKISAIGRLRIEGSDLSTMTCAEIDYEGDPTESFALCAPAKVRAAVNHAGGDRVTLEQQEKTARVACGKLDAAIATFPADDHPGAPRISQERFGVDMGAAELRALARIRPAISTEETRYYLNGVCVRNIGNWLYRFIATDGHRLMIHDVPLPGAEGDLPDNIIIPRAFIDMMLARFGKSREPVRFSFGGAALWNTPETDLAPENSGALHLAVRGELGKVSFAIASKPIDGTFPDVQRVIPKETKHHVEIDRAALVQAIQSLHSLGEGKTRALKFTAEPAGLRIAASHPDFGEATYDVAASHNLPADYLIGFNGQYFLDCCNALSGETVRLELNCAASPSVIRDPADTAFFSVLMPMRV
ncbi:MAG: DNA polymerase III subunit beta [Qipengyuania sp.]